MGPLVENYIPARYNDETMLAAEVREDGAAAHSYPAGSYANAVVAADFNGDGHLDLAVANNGSNTANVLLNNGDGTFKAARSYAIDDNAFSVSEGDFNGDGIPDLAVTNEGGADTPGSTVSVLLGKGDGTFQAAHSYAVGINPFAVAVADFNGDGVPTWLSPAFPG
jgi:hypothetical protein